MAKPKRFLHSFFRSHCSAILLAALFLSLMNSRVQGQKPKEINRKTKRDITFSAPNSNQVQVITRGTVTVTTKPGNTLHELWFNNKGQLISFPPDKLLSGQGLGARIIVDDNFWASRTTTVINTWIKALENMNKWPPLDEVVTYGITDLAPIQEEMAYKIKWLLQNTAYIPADQKQYYLTKLKLLQIDTTIIPLTTYTPEIKDLMVPVFTIEFFFYDKQGARINKNGNPYCEEDVDIQTFTPCDINAAVSAYQINPMVVPPGCFEVKYELRLKSANVYQMMAWTNNPNVVLPSVYENGIVKDIRTAFNNTYLKQLDEFQADLKKLASNQLDRTVQLQPLQDFVASGLVTAKSILDRLNSSAGANPYRKWVLQWLWLTGGIPGMNPLNESASIFPGSVTSKVTPQDKALYQIFDNMVSKGALKISELVQLDSGFNRIPAIKAAMDAEANAPVVEPLQLDRLLYQGMLKASLHGELYMRHLDAHNNYIVMGVGPAKEITEKERMYILVENKPVPLKLSIAFETTAIGPEDSRFTDILRQSPADEFTGTPLPGKLKNSDSLRKEAVIKLLGDFKTLSKQILALRALLLPPALPLFYEKDLSPDLITDNQEHNYLYEAPVMANYTIKQVNPDNTEKELTKGSYRINKLYRFRLKAGLSYSFFNKTDYTETAPNNYTVDNSMFGIDGTFGIQTFFNKQDIRSSQLKFRGFLYTGLSMKKVTENFYIGLGAEPMCGVAISINAHIGKREALVGNNNLPSAIKSEWGIHVAPSILIDPSLFIRLFTFGNSNRSLIGF